MLALPPSPDRQNGHPVILGSGLTGMAVSRALAAAKIDHVLVGGRPADTPRLGESLNAEGSLEIVRQFPDLERFFLPKERQAVFFGRHVLSFDSVRYDAAPAYYRLLGYPPTVQLLHVDRVGFDRALFDTVVADDHCSYVEEPASGLDYNPANDRIVGVRLADGRTILPSYVFDATNHARFVARKAGVRCHQLGDSRRVAFAHYRSGGSAPDPLLPWAHSTSLVRLDSRHDPVEGLAWCIPLGDYVSVGVSVASTAKTNAALLLDWVDKAYARRGIDVRSAFPTRGTPVDFPYEHYNHERCYGRNWLLAGPSCCQFWFPSASGVGTALVAARLAPDVLRAPEEAARAYQAYVADVARGHEGLDWLVRDDPSSVTLEALERRSASMIEGNAERLGDYLGLRKPPSELAFGDALLQLFESDRRKATRLGIATAAYEAQATHIFASRLDPDPWMDAGVEVPVLTRPDNLQGPPAILGLVEILSGRREVETSRDFLTADVKLRIDQFQLEGVAQWNAWVASLRGTKRNRDLELVPGSLTADGDQWVLLAQWQGTAGQDRSISPQLTMTFTVADGRVAAMRTERADHTFVTGDSILPPSAFAAVVGQLVAGASGTS